MNTSEVCALRGRLRGELGPGYYRYLRPYTRIVKLDMRPMQLAVNAQEVLSRDGVAVKASLSATYRIVDIRAAVFNADSYVTALYTKLQQVLRSLANAAQMVQRNPHLFQLRLLQVAGQQSGTRLVMGMPPGAMPLPVRDGQEIEALPPPEPEPRE